MRKVTYQDFNHEQTERMFQSCIIHRIENYPVPIILNLSRGKTKKRKFFLFCKGDVDFLCFYP